jgi:hypothetical protein
MTPWTQRRALALKHVEDGRRVVEQQRALVRRLKAAGFNVARPEELLQLFEQSQRLFEEDLADLDQVPISQRD